MSAQRLKQSFASLKNVCSNNVALENAINLKNRCLSMYLYIYFILFSTGIVRQTACLGIVSVLFFCVWLYDVFAQANSFPEHGNGEADGVFTHCICCVWFYCMLSQSKLFTEMLYPHCLLGHSETDDIFWHGICCVFFAFVFVKCLHKQNSVLKSMPSTLLVIVRQTCLGMAFVVFLWRLFLLCVYGTKFFIKMLYRHCLLGHSERHL